MNSYLGVVGEAAAERIIEKSRFLSYAARTAGEEEAKAFLERIRAMHPLATHVCYGYIADSLGNLQRFSDAGEPQGTAGLPILGVLKAQKLFETTIAVVRYFGGIKLGAGGLTRAYASSAADVVAVSEKRSFEECVEVTLAVGYPDVGACLRFLEGSDAETVAGDYGEEVSFTVAVKASALAMFEAAATDALHGRVRFREGRTYIFPFPL